MPFQIFLRSEGNRVNDKIDGFPLFANLAKVASIWLVLTEIALFNKRRFDAFCQRLDATFEHFSLVGKRQLGALGPQCPGACPCQTVIVRDTKYDTALALHQPVFFANQLRLMLLNLRHGSILIELLTRRRIAVSTMHTGMRAADYPTADAGPQAIDSQFYATGYNYLALLTTVSSEAWKFCGFWNPAS